MDEKENGRGSPIRCVSEFDKAAKAASSSSVEKPSLSPFPNPFLNSKLLELHTKAVRLESTLQPLRLILSRLMAHPTFNRKGIFNIPVDPVGLKLPDYFTIITKPMDFGTIKARLHAIAYNSREEVVEDIRLVLSNAMRYNPPANGVHSSAKSLMSFFEDQLRSFCPELAMGEEDTEAPRKRKKRGTKVNMGHCCQSCHGSVCTICLQGCLHMEPTLLICNGTSCVGAKIRKGSNYYIAKDGSRQYCQRCYAGLPAILPNDDESCRYKRDLLKRRNDEEIVERWVKCSQCSESAHRVCAMRDEFVDSDEYTCPSCVAQRFDGPTESPTGVEPGMYTFVAGQEEPVALDQLIGDENVDVLGAEALPQTTLSSFLQAKVRESMAGSKMANVDKTVSVRVISDCDRYFKVPDVVRNHFRMQAVDDSGLVLPPESVDYRSKAIALFQKIDGLDVCMFCMYVQEYDGSEGSADKDAPAQKKRVYIAYLDSVEHFRPRCARTTVYQEMLVAYLAAARKRGFEIAHIWACPPTRGNSFVFWNHPASQRTPTRERLISWYHGALSRALECGVVSDVKSLFQSDFEHQMDVEMERESSLTSNMDDAICPPLFDGDFWIEEAVRVHGVNFARHMKARAADGSICASGFDEELDDLCPAKQVGVMLRDTIISHPSSAPFRRPVNAAALKLNDYHKIISRPMDLGTVYSRCMLGEYSTLREFVDDVDLVVSNAKRYNPVGHFVHQKADEVSDLFFAELDKLTMAWGSSSHAGWKIHADVSFRLDALVPGALDGEERKSSSLTREVSLLSQCDSVDSASRASMFLGGPDAVHRRMVGSDTWLLDSKSSAPGSKGKGLSTSQKKPAAKRKADDVSEGEPTNKRRRQTWLAEEVATAVRRMRTSFFSVSLNESAGENAVGDDLFSSYVGDHVFKDDRGVSSRIVDSRHSLLEFSQFRNLEFDTLRRAKYSTAVLLYHLHHNDAPGAVPECTTCGVEIEGIRWHKIRKVQELRQAARPPPGGRKPIRLSAPEELCADCHNSHSERDRFIPLPVSFRS